MKRRILLLSALSMLVMTVNVTAGDWSTWRGPNGNGIIENVEWNPKAIENPKIVWETQLGLGYSAVAVKDNRLYTMGNVGTVTGNANTGTDIIYCFDAQTGKEIWRYTYRCHTSERWPGPTATPVLDGDRLYTICDDTGDIYCLNADNGNIIWKRNVVEEFGTVPPYDGVGYSGSPVIEGNMIILNLNTAGIALNKMSGETIWASGSGRCSFSTPVMFNDGPQRKIALFGARKFFVLDITTGKIEGSFPWETNCNENTADPIVFNGKVFISSAYGQGCALLRLTDTNPQLVWKNMEMSNQFNSDVFLDGYVYGIDGERPRCSLKCMDFETGKVMWSEKMPFGQIVSVNGKLVVLDEEGRLHIAEASPESYQEIASGLVQRVASRGSGRTRKYWWTNPVLVDGYLYARSDKGDLVCLDMR